MTGTLSAVVHPCAALGGTATVPGDKSISHRLAMLCALAKGASEIRGFLRSGDCLSTVSAVSSLGAKIVDADEDVLRMEGTGGKFSTPTGPLDLGNSGTTMRLLAGLLAGQPIRTELTGDRSLNSRPMKRIQEPLEQMGARIELTGEKGTAPLVVHGTALHGLTYELPVASAQVKSCVLLAGLYADGLSTVVEPRPTRDHTERVLRAFGVPIEVDGLRIQIEGCGAAGPRFEARDWVVPGDFSSAAFLLAAGAARPGQRVTIQGVGLNPRRTAFLEVLRRMGAVLEVEERTSPGDAEPWGDVSLQGGVLTGTEVGGDDIPNLIDELPLVAALGALAKGETTVRDAAELRVKESDRIAAMARNLRTLGVDVEERADGMVVRGTESLVRGETVDSLGDHRIAMAMAVLGLYAESPVCIADIACVDTSYPEFWNDIRRLGAHVE